MAQNPIGFFRYLLYNRFTRPDHTFQRRAWMGFRWGLAPPNCHPALSSSFLTLMRLTKVWNH